MNQPAAKPPQALVSVVIPTYKRPGYLLQALKSVVAQTHSHLEILVADNANDAESAAIVAGFGDPRITYIARPENLGMIGNVRDLFRRATGQYVSMLADDDTWHPEFVEKLVAPLEQDPSISLAFSDYFVTDAQGLVDMLVTEEYTRRCHRDSLATGKHDNGMLVSLVQRSIPEAIAAIFRREVMDFKDFPNEISSSFDMWLGYLATIGGGAVFYVKERLSNYRIHDGSASLLQFQDLNISARYCYKQWESNPKLVAHHAFFRERQRSLALQLALELLVYHGQSEQSRRHFQDSLRVRFGLRSAIGYGFSLLPNQMGSRLASGARNVVNGVLNRKPPEVVNPQNKETYVTSR